MCLFPLEHMQYPCIQLDGFLKVLTSRLTTVPVLGQPSSRCIGQSGFQPRPRVTMGVCVLPGPLCVCVCIKLIVPGSTESTLDTQARRTEPPGAAIFRNWTLQETPGRIRNGCVRVGEFRHSVHVGSSAQTPAGGALF